MSKSKHAFGPFTNARLFLYRALLIIPVSFTIGSLVALFLWLLDRVTDYRWQHPLIIFLLPLAGIAIVFVYKKYGKNSAAGNNLVIDEIHEPGAGIPARMTPLILASTVITHLFGGSAGREGTAVQMGGSIAHQFSEWYKLSPANKRILLMCGVAAGFGAVFGTPVAGAIFALEVITIGKIELNALIPCLLAGILGDMACRLYGIQHTQYSIANEKEISSLIPGLSFNIGLLIKAILSGIAFGLAGAVFSKLTHRLKDYAGKYLPQQWMIPVCGGLAVIGISYLLGTSDYLGLGVTNPSGGVSIVSSFTAHGANTWSWLWKLLLTAITLSTGFKGGEVTPLFFIGAALGNTLAMISGAPVDLFAGLGFLAVFAGASNTPIACTLMGVELFGSENVIYYAAACFTAYYFSGHTGIYSSQRVGAWKFGKRSV